MLRFEAVGKRYSAGGSEIEVLEGVSLTVEQGEFAIVLGPSGSGKTTLLYLAAGLDDPTSGAVELDGQLLSELDERERSALRRTKVGFVFQLFQLVQGLTAIENVALPLRFNGHSRRAAHARARELLERVGLGARERHYPTQLSGGEMQRVGLARALAPRPRLLLADEPTGSLDAENGQLLLSLIREAVGEQGGSVVLVTHDARAVPYGDRLFTLCDGRVEAPARSQVP
jgi:putative ABC transport system ATP-binding protein